MNEANIAGNNVTILLEKQYFKRRKNFFKGNQVK